MDNNIKVFENSEFGKVRTVILNDEPWFIGKDVTDILGYQNGSRDINRHVVKMTVKTTKMVLLKVIVVWLSLMNLVFTA